MSAILFLFRYYYNVDSVVVFFLFSPYVLLSFVQVDSLRLMCERFVLFGLPIKDNPLKINKWFVFSKLAWYLQKRFHPSKNIEKKVEKKMIHNTNNTEPSSSESQRHREWKSMRKQFIGICVSLLNGWLKECTVHFYVVNWCRFAIVK